VAETLMSLCPHGHDSPAVTGFCGTCGARMIGWQLTARADRKYYEFVIASGPTEIPFPLYCPERRFDLRRGRLLIGRRSVSRGIEPEIDLTGPPEDTSVGRSHAVLVFSPDNSWNLVDLDSVNGTYLNYSADPIEPNVPVPVGDGDLIHVGGWTTLTLSAAG
jgi:pSer/pThr/pTyr-binding forkhead associated (FHA) protein